MNYRMEPIKSVRGVRDIHYPESEIYSGIEKTCSEILEAWGYRKIYLPVMEFSELFKRSIGDETDIVSKEMYTFSDRKGRSLSLRPEGTASAVRAMIEGNFLQGRVREKVYYAGPMFRYERPQEGRYRQFHQIGCEVFGSSSPASDAELASVAFELLKACRVSGYTLKINSVGCPGCRPFYRDEIQKFLRGREQEICADCRKRGVNNPLRVLDCKNSRCREAYKDIPSISKYLCGECREYYARYKTLIVDRGIDFSEDESLVRGLDYYTGPVFELEAEGGVIAAGGRYDSLVKELGGPETPACGWAFGLERLSLSSGITARRLPEVYIALMPGGGVKYASKVAERIRAEGISVEEDYEEVSPKKKLRMADRKNAAYAVLIGGEETEGGFLQLRDLSGGGQSRVSEDDLVEELYKYKEGRENK